MRKFLPAKREMQFNGNSFEILKFCPIYIDGSLYQPTSLCYINKAMGNTLYLMIKEANDIGNNELVFFGEFFEADCDSAYYYAKKVSMNDFNEFQDAYQLGKSVTSFDLLTLLEIL